MQRKSLLALFGLILVAGCGPQPPSYSRYPTTSANVVPARSTSDRASEGAKWAKEQIRSGARKPLSVAEAQTLVRRAMRDPESVRFRSVRSNASTGAVCGIYNAKNGFGGYAGETPFIYFHDPDYQTPQVMYGPNIAGSIIIFSVHYCE